MSYLLTFIGSFTGFFVAQLILHAFKEWREFQDAKEMVMETKALVEVRNDLEKELSLKAEIKEEIKCELQDTQELYQQLSLFGEDYGK